MNLTHCSSSGPGDGKPTKPLIMNNIKLVRQASITGSMLARAYLHKAHVCGAEAQ